ncbi:MAG: DKNYY domain-containing protein [Bacteroidales bacterium]|nr:DKNYY domain-containing protein [Bacteroidales bacterium]
MTLCLLTACDGYKVEGGKVYVYGWNEGRWFYKDLLEGADAKTFRELDDHFACDKDHVWYAGALIEGARAATFRVVGHGYATDGVHCYGQWGKVFDVADPSTFSAKSDYLTEDATDYYWDGRPVHVADKATFVVLPAGSVSQWAKDKHYVYNLCFIPEDADTLVRVARIPIADYDTFEPLRCDEHPVSQYARDKRQVYFGDTIVAGADVATFRHVGYNVGQDCHRVYYCNRATQIKDFSALREVGHFYIDGKHVYNWHLSSIPDADVATLRELDMPWAVDAHHVFHSDRLVPGADPKTFSAVRQYDHAGRTWSSSPHWDYGKDATHVYWRDSLIAGADAATFSVVASDSDDGGWVVFDKNRIYQGADCKTVERFKREVLKLHK